MLLNTNTAKTSLEKILRVKDTYIFQGSSYISSKEDGRIMVSCFDTHGKHGVECVLAEGYVGKKINSIIDTKKLHRILSSCKEQEVEVSIEDRNLEITGSISAKISIFDNNASYWDMDKLEKGNKIGTGEFLSQADLTVIGKYLPFVSLSSDHHDRVYVKDNVLVTNIVSIRKHNAENPMPVAASISRNLYSIIHDMGSSVAEFYENLVYLEKDGVRMVFSVNSDDETKYNSLNNFSFEPDSDSSFTFNKDEISKIIRDLKHFIPTEDNKIKLDIKNNKLIIENSRDVITADVQFTSKGEFTYKLLNSDLLVSMLLFYQNDVEVFSDVVPQSSLFFSNDTEEVVLTYIEG